MRPRWCDCRENAAKEQELTERAACPRGPAAPDGHARKRRGATVRTVRIVRARNYLLRSNGLLADRWRTVDGAADDHQPDAATTVRTKSLKSNAGTVADDADANGARRSGGAELPPV